MAELSKLVKPVFVFFCVHCGAELREWFDTDEDEAQMLDDCDWSAVTPERALSIIEKRGWVIGEFGYPFCSPPCVSKHEIEWADSFRKLKYKLTEALGDAVPASLRFGG